MDTNNMNDLIGAYVGVRDKIAEIEATHKKELEPYKTALDKIESRVMELLNASGMDSAKTESGTAYITTATSVTVADKSAFMDFVTSQGAFDFLDVKDNKTAVSEYADANQALPPGVNLTRRVKVGFRRG